MLPLAVSAQELLGKKKKYIDSVKSNSDIIIDTPEMTIWNNRTLDGAKYLICYFQDEKCYKSVSIFPADKLAHWEKILDNNCMRVKGQDKLWIDQKRKMMFKILPGENGTFGLESTKSNE